MIACTAKWSSMDLSPGAVTALTDVPTPGADGGLNVDNGISFLPGPANVGGGW